MRTEPTRREPSRDPSNRSAAVACSHSVPGWSGSPRWSDAVEFTAAHQAAGFRDAVRRQPGMNSSFDPNPSHPCDPTDLERGPEATRIPDAAFATLCAGGGTRLRDGEPLVAPIVQSTSFARDGLESTAQHRYSRESNPTVSALEAVLGRLERAPDALAFATGLAAETALLLAVAKAGDHVVCSRAVYGGTSRLLRQVLVEFGVSATFVDTTDAGAVARALRPRTKLVLVETPANPTLALSDIRAIAAHVRRSDALLAVDNTFLTPVLQQPLDLGAHVSILSTTKFVEGHSVALGGALVTRDEALRERLFFLRKCTGAIQSPFQAWLTLQGLRTLPVRIERQSANARRIARWLAGQVDVRVVHHPSLPAFPQSELAASQHRGEHGAVVSFELDGGPARARRLLRAVKLCRVAEHVGSVETLLTHSASMTHAAVPREEREAVGITDALVRLSVGLEDPRDVIDDLDAAIQISRSAPAHEEAKRCPAI